MKLYNEAMPAPNPRRVRMFLAEKGVEIPVERVSMRDRQHKAPEFMAKNSLGQLPVLELDDGTHLSESVSICRYLEGLYPDPPLFGTTPKEQALIDMWIRRAEFQLGTPLRNFWVHAHPYTAAIVEQHKEFGESNRAHAERAYRWLDSELAGKDYIAGDAFTVADIIALSMVDFGAFIGLPFPQDATNLKTWHDRVSARPSASA